MIARRQAVAGLLASGAALALPAPAWPAEAPGAPEQRLGRLLAAIDRAESIRAAKALQRSFAQYHHHGLWDELGALFAPDGVLEWGGEVMRGPAAIAERMRALAGGGRDGLAPGALHAQLLMAPVVTLAPGGEHARGRWHEVRMASGETAWTASLLSADYVRTGGRWGIARLISHPIFAGPYATGWRNVLDDLPVIPYFYSPDSAGRPQTGRSPAPPEPVDRLPEASRRLAALLAEDAARNLQNIYGYYVDRKMWDDVADLFAADGVLAIEGVGRFEGPAAIRRALERHGPQGLRHGELFDHPQLNATVEIAPSAGEARIRGLELGMTGINGGDAAWTLTTFDNRFVRRADGAWTIAEMRLYPEMEADYYRGWDAREPAADAPRQIAAFGPNPATGAAVRYPDGLDPVAHPFIGAGGAANEDDLEAAELALARTGAFDAIENISSSIGNYLNDSMWYELSRLFARDGWRKSPSAGYYQGPDRIWRMQLLRNGPMRRPRAGIPLHLRLQPVIHVSGDGRTAKLRTRLLQFNSSRTNEGSMTGGMYEDRLVLEDGIWRFELDDIDHIWRTPGYAKGWARVEEGAGERLSRTPERLLEQMPPDRPIAGRAFPPFPAIGRLWFHYRNPVSGRAPPDLLPD